MTVHTKWQLHYLFSSDGWEADWFYLGNSSLGFLQVCTVGFYGMDFILISIQTVGPSKSSCSIDYYGTRLTRILLMKCLEKHNKTFRVTQFKRNKWPSLISTDNTLSVDFQIFSLLSSHSTLWVLYDYFCLWLYFICWFT